MIHQGGSAHFAAAQFQSFERQAQQEEVVLPTLAEVDQIRRQAYEDGFSQGFAKGLDDAQQQTRSIQTLFDDMDAFLHGLSSHYEEGMRGVLEQLLQTMQSAPPEVLLERVSRAVKFCSTGAAIEVRLSASDLELLESRVGEALRAGAMKVSAVVSDPALRAGEFVIAHGGGEIRSTLSERLSSVVGALRGAL